MAKEIGHVLLHGNMSLLLLMYLTLYTHSNIVTNHRGCLLAFESQIPNCPREQRLTFLSTETACGVEIGRRLRDSNLKRCLPLIFGRAAVSIAGTLAIRRIRLVELFRPRACATCLHPLRRLYRSSVFVPLWETRRWGRTLNLSVASQRTR